MAAPYWKGIKFMNRDDVNQVYVIAEEVAKRVMKEMLQKEVVEKPINEVAEAEVKESIEK